MSSSSSNEETENSKLYPFIPKIADGDGRYAYKLYEVISGRYLEIDGANWVSLSNDARDKINKRRPEAYRCSQVDIVKDISLSDAPNITTHPSRVTAFVKKPMSFVADFFMRGVYQGRKDVNPGLEPYDAADPDGHRCWFKLREITKKDPQCPPGVESCAYRYIKVSATPDNPTILDSMDFMTFEKLDDEYLISMISAFYGTKEEGFAPCTEEKGTGRKMQRVQNYYTSFLLSPVKGSPNETKIQWTSVIRLDGLTSCISKDNEIDVHCERMGEYIKVMESM